MSSKSLIAKIEEIILRHTKIKFMDSQEEADRFLAEGSNIADEPVKSVFKSHDFNGMQVFTFGNPEECENIILYVHGGAYAMEINMQHHLFCMMLSRKLNAHVLAPVYGLAPRHTALEAFDEIGELYEHLLKKQKSITLMGDSAGGGFVLSFAQYLKTIGRPQPDHIVAISPWVDISMSNTPYDSKNDPILGDIGLREVGKSWAGDLNTHDYRVSPLFGDSTGLADTLIFAGSDEIFFRDIERYVERSDNARLIVGEGMFHIYPLFPSSEARAAFKEIRHEIIG